MGENFCFFLGVLFRVDDLSYVKHCTAGNWFTPLAGSNWIILLCV